MLLRYYLVAYGATASEGVTTASASVQHHALATPSPLWFGDAVNVGMPVGQISNGTLALWTDQFADARLESDSGPTEGTITHRGARQCCNTHCNRS
jgi:hypothetical protein